MWRLIFLISAIPLIAGGAAAQLLGFRVLRRNFETHLDVDSFLAKLKQAANCDDIKIVYSSKLWLDSSGAKDGQVVLHQKLKEKKDANSLALAAIQFGLCLLRVEHKATVEWRQKMVKSGYVLPVFVMMVGLFTSLVGKMPAKIALAAIAASFGFVTTMLWLSMPVEKEAASLVIQFIEKHRLFSRIHEEEAVVNAIKATCWASLLPGSLRSFMTAYKPEKSPNS